MSAVRKWMPALLFLLAALVYANAIPNGFTQDDHSYVERNPALHESPWRLFAASYDTGLRVYRPLTAVSYWINFETLGSTPGGFHFINVMLHAGVVLLLYYLLLELFGRAAPAAAASAIFAVHPIHTEAVSAIVGRAELLCAGFLFAAWIMHRRERYAAAWMLFLASIFCKETAAGFVPLVILGDWALLGARHAEADAARRRWGAYAAYVAALGVYLAARRVVLGKFGTLLPADLDNPLAHLTPLWRIPNALNIAMKYLALQIYPAHLSADYSINAIPMHEQWTPLLPAIALSAVLLALWLWSYRRYRAEFLAGAIYLCGFAVTANILLPIGTLMGERLAYLPSAGFCLLAALLWERLYRARLPLAVAVLAVVIAALGARTIVRNRDWKDDFTLFSAAVRTTPENARAHLALGKEYLRRRQIDLALEQLTIAERIYPDYPDVWTAKGSIYFLQGDAARAEPLLRQAMLRSLGTFNEDDTAVTYAAFLLQTGHTEGGLKVLDIVIGRNPNYSRAYSNRAVAVFRLGQRDAAARDVQNALRLDPNNEQALSLLRALSQN